MADWAQLARDLGSLNGPFESGGTSVARMAIKRLLGKELLVDAARHAIRGVEGSETARSILVLLQPRCAMEHAHEVLLTDVDVGTKDMAGSVLAHIADESALPWIAPLLDSKEGPTQRAGCALLRTFIWDRDVDEDLTPLIEQARAKLSPSLWEELERAANEYEPPS